MKRRGAGYYVGTGVAAMLILVGCNNGVSAVAPPTPTQQDVTRHGMPREPQSGSGPPFTSLYSFTGGSDGWTPAAGLTALKGLLYGATAEAIFSITTSGQLQVIHTFKGPPSDAKGSSGLLAVNGVLYGTSAEGGNGPCQIRHKVIGCGTVFSITTSGQEQVLYNFQGPDGQFPAAGLTLVNGTLYGTTASGGERGYGTIFSTSTYGEETVLYSFAGDEFGDGEEPRATLADVGGTLYGTTSAGGSANCNAYFCGTVFSIAASGQQYAVLHSFKGGKDGHFPIAGLVDDKGTLYGTTAQGGRFGYGTVFSINGAREKVLYSFRGGSDGANPSASLIDVKGTLYGTTAYGGGSANCVGTSGAAGCGTVFSITRAGKEHILHSFSGTDGAKPVARLVKMGPNLYGTTYYGGTRNFGTVFEISP